ncbi:MAG TPA: DUF3365 domain-containing protein [Planctomycetes bacterium]|nr:DUF3365 domain-containing protein [Planctomycetota bacterium]
MPSRSLCSLLAVLTGALALSSCSKDSEPLSPEMREAFRAKAKVTTEAFVETLGAALKAALKEGGPSHAIEVCAKEAPKIAGRFSTDGIQVHRIGTRVRNPHSGTPTLDERELLQKLSPTNPDILEPVNGKLVYLRAIYISKPLCLKCHGGPNDIAPQTRETLARLYPDDKATGYKMGDLRGAFVVRAR